MVKVNSVKECDISNISKVMKNFDVMQGFGADKANCKSDDLSIIFFAC